MPPVAPGKPANADLGTTTQVAAKSGSESTTAPAIGKPRDMDRAFDLAEGLGIVRGDRLAYVVIPGPPWSKSRPRFTRNGRTYQPAGDRDAEERTGSFLKKAVPEQFPGNVGMVCLFYRPNHQRIDADNLLKHVCDSGNGILWKDDSQCTGILGILELDAENPRTVVVVGEHTSTLTRGVDDTVPCAICKTPIQRRRGKGDRSKTIKTCSRECTAIIKGQHKNPANPHTEARTGP